MGEQRNFRRIVVAGSALAVSLALTAAGAAQAAFPPAKNGRIVYEAHPVENSDVFLMGANGSNPLALTEPSLRTSDSAPSFSPNGKLIVYSADIDPDPENSIGNHDIFVMRPNGTGKRNLTPGRPFDSSNPVFSPDGRLIAFTEDTEPGDASITDIFLMRADGSGIRNLTNTPDAPEGSPDFSPDGKRIAFSGGPNFSDRGIHVMNANGTGAVNLTLGSTTEDVSPSFSPDGRRIAFIRDVNPGMPIEFRLHVMAADGTGQANIAGTTLNDSAPSFSPDGKLIALPRVVVEGPEFTYDIFTMPSGGGAATNLTAPSAVGLEVGPRWEYVYKCAGKRATIVGDDGKDKIKGTKKADVIVGNGGRDKIKGGKGNDRICGGKGKDVLIGGKGKDRLKGGKGKDREAQ